jgi:hypothetical protein
MRNTIAQTRINNAAFAARVSVSAIIIAGIIIPA